MPCKFLVFFCIYLLTVASAALAERTLFVSDPGFPIIVRAELDSQLTTTILHSQNELLDVAALAVDELNKKLYWVSPQNATIYRANYDGSQIELIAFVGGFPEGLAIDQVAGKLYISASTSPSLYRINAIPNQNNPAKEVLITASSALAPTGLNLNFIERKIYWVDLIAQRVSRANFDGTNRENISLVPNVDVNIGLALAPLFNLMYFGNFSAGIGGYVDNRDLNGSITNDPIIPDPIGAIPRSIVLDQVNLEVFWVGGNLVSKANLISAVAEPLIFNLESPHSLAIDLPCSGFSQDSDLDGFPDCADQCPSDIFKVQPSLCGCHLYEFNAGRSGVLCLNSFPSCAQDFDFDGTPDCADLCPTDPLKLIPGICGCESIDFIFNDGSLLCFDFPVITFDTVIDAAPEVIIQDNDVTIILKQFSEVMNKKTKKMLARFVARANAKSKKSPKLKFRYDVRLTQMSNGKGVKKKSLSQKITKKNQVTYKNLKSGSYKVNYRVQITKKNKVVKNTNFSPASTFSIK